jgi:Flp pilus assembly protein TadD
VVFGQTVNYEFTNFDDHVYVYENSHITHDPPAQGILWAFTSKDADNWHPLTWLSHILDYQLYGLWAGGHHLTSVLLHAVTAIMLFLVLWRMTADLWPSAFVAAVFAIHPLRVESVAWVAERKDVLSGLFFMLTLWAYLGYVRRPFSLVRYLTVMASFALGLMSKPMLVTLPFVLLLLDFWPLRRFSENPSCSGSHCTTTPKATAQRPFLHRSSFQRAWHLLIEKAPLLLLTVASCFLTTWAQKKAIVGLESLSLSSRIANSPVSCVAYLVQFVYPAGLAVCYPHPMSGLPIWRVAGALLVLAAISLGVLACWRRNPYLLVGWFWYLGMLVPVIGLVQVGAQAMADRYTYLPQIGLCIALAWGIAHVAKLWPYRRSICRIASALAITILIGCSWRQTTFWCDSEMLWTRALACAPHSFKAQCNLGSALTKRGRFDEAIEHLQAALDLKPHNAEAHVDLGIALASRGRADEAITQYRDALKIKPDYVDAHCNLAVALMSQGQIGEAITHFHEAVNFKPDNSSALNNLAWLLATCPEATFRNGAEAVKSAERALHLSNGQEPTILDTLAAAYAEAGRFPEAVQTARKALDLVNRQNNESLAEGLKARLRLYEAGTPYRDNSAAAATPAPQPARSP